MKLSMQTYTVQADVQRDLWGSLEALRAMELNYVEIGGTYGLPAQELKDGLDRIGLKVSGNHYNLATLENEFDRVVDECRTLDIQYVIIPSVDRELHSQGWDVVAKRLEPIGAKLKAEGLTFSYHNHAFEFALQNGKPGLDVLYETANPAVLGAQIDTYWVAYGGGDPAAYIRKLKGRVHVIHLKDGLLGRGEPHFLEGGQGELDWDDILAACDETGVKFGAIELDVCPREPMVSAKASVDFFRSKGITE